LITLSGSVVQENSPAVTQVGTLSISGYTGSAYYNYALASGSGDTDNADFSISGNTLYTRKTFDYETRSSYSIRIRAVDTNGITYEKAFTITILNVNDAPTAVDKTYKLQPGNSLSGKLIAIDSDSQTLYFSITSEPTKGTVTITNHSTGDFIYTPNSSTTASSAPDSFIFKVSDGNGWDTATVTIEFSGTYSFSGLELRVRPETINLSKSNGKSPIFVTIRLQAANLDSADIRLSSLKLTVGGEALDIKKSPRLLMIHGNTAYITAMFYRSDIPRDLDLDDGRITFTASLNVNGLTYSDTDTVRVKLPKDYKSKNQNWKGNGHKDYFDRSNDDEDDEGYEDYDFDRD
jgi:VCBS repeat-containing protein